MLLHHQKLKLLEEFCLDFHEIYKKSTLNPNDEKSQHEKAIAFYCFQ